MARTRGTAVEMITSRILDVFQRWGCLMTMECVRERRRRGQGQCQGFWSQHLEGQNSITWGRLREKQVWTDQEFGFPFSCYL